MGGDGRVSAPASSSWRIWVVLFARSEAMVVLADEEGAGDGNELLDRGGTVIVAVEGVMFVWG